jgi:uncharacterized membrane protein
MIAVVFSNETDAYEGSRALRQLDGEGSIAVYAAAVVTKTADGEVTVKEAADSSGMDTLAGTGVGALIGLLGGPVGAVVGAAGGTLVGGAYDLDQARVDADFVSDVSEILAPGTTVLLAEIDEEWTTPLDTSMESTGGVVFRRSLADIIESQDQRSADAMRADIAQMKLEHAEAKAERKEKLKAKIDALQAKLDNKEEQGKARREAIRHEADAKIEMLKAKAAQAKGNVKSKQEQRIASVKKTYGEWLERLGRRAEEPAQGRASSR